MRKLVLVVLALMLLLMATVGAAMCYGGCVPGGESSTTGPRTIGVGPVGR